jgi:hypothetical protein
VLNRLRRWVIDLEDLQSVLEVLVPKGERFEARADHHILSDAAVDGFEQMIFRIPCPGEDGSWSRMVTQQAGQFRAPVWIRRENIGGVMRRSEQTVLNGLYVGRRKQQLREGIIEYFRMVMLVVVRSEERGHQCRSAGLRYIHIPVSRLTDLETV